MKQAEDETADRLADLEPVVRRTPNYDRRVFLAHRLDHLGYAEIARRTGASIAEVEQAISRAMCTIDRELSRPRRRRWF